MTLRQYQCAYPHYPHLEVLEELGHIFLPRYLHRPRVQAEPRAHHVEVLTSCFRVWVYGLWFMLYACGLWCVVYG